MIKKGIMLATALMLCIGMAFATATPDISVTESDALTMIIGTVTDAETGEAISGAEVSLNEAEATATTDEYGSFTIEGIEAGTYTLEVDAEGYAASEVDVEVTEEGANVSIELETEY